MNSTELKEGFLGQKMISLPKSIVSYAKENNITKDFYVTDLGYYPKANHHYRRRKKGSSQYIFIYCTKGKGEVIIDNQCRKILPNQFIIIPKKTNHEYKANESDPWSIYWFHFNGKTAKNLFERYEKMNSSNYKNIRFSEEKIELFEKIFTVFNQNNINDQIEYCNLLSLNLISSFIYHEYEYRMNDENKNSIVNSVKKYLSSNLDKNFTLATIANKFNYSKSYLHTKFKVNTGYPILVFFNIKKVQKACEYLNCTDLSIKEISFKVGFEDPLYFSRIFKKYMGKSPRNYKKSNHK